MSCYGISDELEACKGRKVKNVEVADEDVELGGLTVVGGLRWTF